MSIFKHIAIFLPSLGGGGAERVMLNFANELVDQGLKIDLVLVSANGPFLKDIDQRIRVIDLGCKRQLNSTFSLISYIRKNKPSAIFSALVTTNIIALTTKVFLRTKFKVIISERAVSSIALKHIGFPQRYILPKLIKLFYRRADAIIAVSNGVKEDLEKKFMIPGHLIKVIYNPVNYDEILLKKNKSIVHPVFRNSKEKIIISVGRLTKQKNFKLLISAFAAVNENISSTMIILGEGDLKKTLIQHAVKLRVEQKVHFLGFVDNPFAWMARADLFVLSSDYEGLPGSLLQAMVCGTKVVSTDCPSGPAEILQGGKWGRLVPVNDKNALTCAMINALKEKFSPDVSKRANYFSIKKAMQSFNKLLEQL